MLSLPIKNLEAANLGLGLVSSCKLTKPKLTFCSQIFCQACVHHKNKVFPKEICLVSVYNLIPKKILGAANVDLGLVNSRSLVTVVSYL